MHAFFFSPRTCILPNKSPSSSLIVPSYHPNVTGCACASSVFCLRPRSARALLETLDDINNLSPPQVNQPLPPPTTLPDPAKAKASTANKQLPPSPTQASAIKQTRRRRHKDRRRSGETIRAVSRACLAFFGPSTSSLSFSLRSLHRTLNYSFLPTSHALCTPFVRQPSLTSATS